MEFKNKNTLPGLSSFVVNKPGKNKYSNFTPGFDNIGNTLTFPDFSIMPCKQLEQEIKNMTETLNAESLVIKNPVWVSSYEDAINTATVFYNSKGCAAISVSEGIKENNLPLDGGGTVIIGNTDDGTAVKIVPVITTHATVAGTPVVATAISDAKKIHWGLILVVAVVGLVFFTGSKGTSA